MGLNLVRSLTKTIFEIDLEAVRDIPDSRMTAGVFTLNRLSLEGINDSVELISCFAQTSTTLDCQCTPAPSLLVFTVSVVLTVAQGFAFSWW